MNLIDISVIMPTYSRNKNGFLKKAIESVLNQSYQNFEFIIIDDGSSDGSEETIKKYLEWDSRIVYIRHDENSKLPALRVNEGILKSRGQYIAFMFDDNVWEKNALSDLYNAINNTSYDMCYGKTKMYFSKLESYILGECTPELELLYTFNMIPNGTVMCRKDFFDNYGLYDPHVSMTRLCDWELWLRAVYLGAKLKKVNNILSTEYGPSMIGSLGRSINLDYKITQSLITDPKTFQLRRKKLIPQHYKEYDCKDYKILDSYYRNDAEKEFLFENVIRHYDPDIMTLNYEGIVTEKERLLIVTNFVFDEIILLRYEFEKMGLLVNIITEWQLNLITPESFDYSVFINPTSKLVNCASRWHRSFGVGIAQVHLNDSIDEGYKSIFSSQLKEQIGYTFDFNSSESNCCDIVGLAETILTMIYESKDNSKRKSGLFIWKGILVIMLFYYKYRSKDIIKILGIIFRKVFFFQKILLRKLL